MNKRFTLLCALALFGIVSIGYAADEIAPQNQNSIQQEEEKVSQDNTKTENAYWKNFKEFYHKHKTAIRWGSAGIVAVYFGHKILYNSCSGYKNWINGTDIDNENAEAAKLPWTH